VKVLEQSGPKKAIGDCQIDSPQKFRVAPVRFEKGYYPLLERRIIMKVSKPVPSKAIEEGSGTGAAKNAPMGVRFAPVLPLFRTVPAPPTATVALTPIA
jgi:hypothetical protein